MGWGGEFFVFFLGGGGILPLFVPSPRFWRVKNGDLLYHDYEDDDDDDDDDDKNEEDSYGKNKAQERQPQQRQPWQRQLAAWMKIKYL